MSKAGRQLTRLDTEILTSQKNLNSMMDAPGKWIDRAGQHHTMDKLILDLNPGRPGVSETCGRRERPS